MLDNLQQNINIGNQTVIMTLLWIMVTGAMIWVMDNFLKRFENTMEDGFRKQARNINDSFRVNVTLLLISLSVFGYYRYYLKQDISSLKNVLNSLLELLYSVGHFILYLLAYIVYGGYSAIGGNYSPGRPEPDSYVLLGFVVMFSYVVIKRLFFKRVPPLLWAVIVAAVMVGFNFLSERLGWDIKGALDRQTQFVRKSDQDSTKNDETIPYTPVENENPKPKEEKKEEKPVVSNYTATEIIVFKDKLLTAIENYDRIAQRTRPNRSDYLDNETAFQNALISHQNDLRQTDEYKTIEQLFLDFKKKGLWNNNEIREALYSQLCEYYPNDFDDNICPPMAR